MEDLQYYEIAEILNISIGTVMSRPFYGRKKLQSVLEPFCMPYMPLERARIAGRAYRPNSIYMSGQTFRHGAGTRGQSRSILIASRAAKVSSSGHGIRTQYGS
jgi:hypothetical protein